MRERIYVRLCRLPVEMMMKFIRPVLNLKGPSLYYIIRFVQCFQMPPEAHTELSLPIFSNSGNYHIQRGLVHG